MELSSFERIVSNIEEEENFEEEEKEKKEFLGKSDSPKNKKHVKYIGSPNNMSPIKRRRDYRQATLCNQKENQLKFKSKNNNNNNNTHTNNNFNKNKNSKEKEDEMLVKKTVQRSTSCVGLQLFQRQRKDKIKNKNKSRNQSSHSPLKKNIVISEGGKKQRKNIVRHSKTPIDLGKRGSKEKKNEEDGVGLLGLNKINTETNYGSVKTRTDRNGNIISKENKKNFGISFDPNFTNVVEIESFKKYNVVTFYPSDSILNSKNIGCICCSIW